MGGGQCDIIIVDGQSRRSGIKITGFERNVVDDYARAFDKPALFERERPPFWRYWLALPPRGRIVIKAESSFVL